MTVVDTQLWCGPGHSQQCFACFGDCPHNAASGWQPPDDERARGARFVRVVFEEIDLEPPRPCPKCGKAWTITGDWFRQLCLDCLRGGEDRIRGRFHERGARAAAHAAMLLDAACFDLPALKRLVWHHDLGDGVSAAGYRVGCRVGGEWCNHILPWRAVSEPGEMPARWPDVDDEWGFEPREREDELVREHVRRIAGERLDCAREYLRWGGVSWRLPSYQEYERAEELVRQRVLVEGLEIAAPARPLVEFDWYRWELPEDRGARARGGE